MSGTIYLKTKHCPGLSFRPTQPFSRHHCGAGAPSEALGPHRGDRGCPRLVATATDADPHGHGSSRPPLRTPTLRQHGQGHGERGTVRAREVKDKLLISFPRSCHYGKSISPAHSSSVLSSAQEWELPSREGQGSTAQKHFSSVPLWCSCQCKLRGLISKPKRLFFRELGEKRAATERKELPRAGHFCCLSCCFFSLYASPQSVIFPLQATQ